MSNNNSPWLYQIQKLQESRAITRLDHSTYTDITIVGGGIAGITTAYYILRNTPFHVIVLEAGKVAHGATGHNAGHVLSQFERPFASIVDEFGLALAGQAQRKIDSAWILLESILDEAQLQTPFFQVTGYTGLQSMDHITSALNDSFFRAAAGLRPETMFVAAETDAANEIPKRYHNLYSCIPQKDLLALLETDDTHYVAGIAARKGCINSASFTEELAQYLLEEYSDRFSLYEQSPVEKITLKKGEGVLNVNNETLQTKRVVLCTNGFDNLTIENEIGKEASSKFHHIVKGTVGYMAGYLEDMDMPPSVLRYYSKTASRDPHMDDPYFYLTRRPFVYDDDNSYNLVALGGPEVPLKKKETYSADTAVPDEYKKQLDDFFTNEYQGKRTEKVNNKFYWHGLMGYTPNGLRTIGPDPNNSVLMYNLGCNGIGILTSIYGAHRIAEYIQGKRIRKSIFDLPSTAQ